MLLLNRVKKTCTQKVKVPKQEEMVSLVTHSEPLVKHYLTLETLP